MARNDMKLSQFPLVPLSQGSLIAMWLLCAVLPISITALALGIVFMSAKPEESINLLAGSAPLTVALALVLVGAITLPLAWWLHRSAKRLAVELREGVLELRASWYHQRIAVTDIDLGKSRVVRLSERPELRPMLKTNGMALPGFSAGHFRLRDWKTKAFCILTERERVLALTERSGRMILLSLQQPQALLDALNQTVDSSARHR